MTAVVSLHANPEKPAAAAEVIDAVSGRLSLTPRPGADGSWEFTFGGSYAAAHAEVAAALSATDPEWPAKVTLDYALAI
jgi:hypothetical protein